MISKVNQSELVGLEELKEIYENFDSNPDALLMETQRNRTVSYKVIKP